MMFAADLVIVVKTDNFIFIAGKKKKKNLILLKQSYRFVSKG